MPQEIGQAVGSKYGSIAISGLSSDHAVQRERLRRQRACVCSETLNR